MARCRRSARRKPGRTNRVNPRGSRAGTLPHFVARHVRPTHHRIRSTACPKPHRPRRHRHRPYRWLENRDAEDVLAYLKAENAYLEEQLADQAELREALFQEIKSRIRETDLSLPAPGAMAVLPAHHRRRRVSPALPLPAPLDGSLTVDESAEQLLLDPNELAGGGFRWVPSASAAPQQARLQPRPRGRRDLPAVRQGPASGAVTELPFDNCDGSMTWANDSQTLFYGELDETHRPHKIYRHRLGDTDSSEVYHDPDGRFFVHCYRASSDRQLVILSHSKTTSEAWVLSADQPEGSWTCRAAP